MKNLLTALSGALLLLPGIPQTSYAQEQPACLYADSDPDGDGFGWENRDTCIMTNQSAQNAPLACVDDDGDGYGWNGREVCRVDIADCHDSDPVGDGWGWNGVTSCEIVAFPSPFSELEVFRTQNRRFSGESVATATLICNRQEDDPLVFDLHENGTLNSFDTSLPSFGVWTTGFSDSDGIVDIWLFGGNISTRHRVLMQPGSITLRGAGPSFDSDNCFWAV